MFNYIDNPDSFCIDKLANAKRNTKDAKITI